MKVCSTLKFGLIVWLFASIAQAQSIDISKFYYRDYLDFGQNKGAFSGNGSTTITGKDGTKFTIPQTPNFSASSNNGNLAAVGRGFAVTANHVTSPEQSTSTQELRKWGLTLYTIAQMDTADASGFKNSVSKPYGRDEKFLRFDKYIVEGQVDMLNIDNNEKKDDTSKDQQNIDKFKEQLKQFADDSGKIYIYQAGSGVIDLRNDSPYSKTDLNRLENGETKGGGFAILDVNSATYYDLVHCPDCQDLYGDEYKPDSRGITFTYNANTEGNFNNRITSGDSGSGIYAFNQKTNQWVLLGVTSQSTKGNVAYIAAVSNKDLLDFQQQFEQKINLKIQDHADANTWTLKGNDLTYQRRGDAPNGSYILQNNKDLIFSGGGTIEVQGNINRNTSGYAGGFVFEASSGASSTNPTKYTFTNANGGNYSFTGSGLDIGENVKVEWHLRNGQVKKGNETIIDTLHKIGKGELVITTQNNTSENLGTLKIGEGKVTLDTNKKAFDNIYITSGRGELALVNGKAQALGASPTTTNGVNSANSATSATSYTLAQENTNNMGFYFGTGGGKLDLAGNSLVLNTIAANDSKAIITNSNTSLVDLEIQGLGYADGKKTQNKADTIIHASIGDNANGANLNLIYKGDKTAVNSHSERSEESNNSGLDSSLSTKAQNDNTAQTSGLPRVASNARNDDSASDLIPSLRANEVSAAIQESSKAHLIFDGNINTSGKMEVTNGNIALQGHATTHATISNPDTIDKIKNAENGTKKGMESYMDLSKPSHLEQPDWGNRSFKFGTGGITLTNSNLTLGRNATLESDITASNNSTIRFGGNVKHFIDNKDGKNVTGSGFSYQQLVESDALSAEMQKIANETIHYKGKITATGGTIESHIWDFNANLDLKDGSKLDAKHLTLTQSSTMNLTNSTAKVENLIFKGFQNGNDFSNKFKLESGSTFSVTQALSFDNSTFDLSKLSNANAGLTLPQEYNLYAFNGSTITTTNEFKNTNANAEFVLDNSTFKATSAVSFQSAKISVQNGASFNAQNLNFTANSIISLADSGKLTLTGDLQTQDLNLNLLNSSTMSAKSLTSNGASTINLNDKAELTLTNTFTSENLMLTLKNESKFTAQTLTASGVVKLQGDKNATLTLETLNLNNGNATLNANGSITTLNLNNVKETAIGENVSITTLTLKESTANLQNLNTNALKSIDLQSNSNLHFNELNLNEFNTKGLNLTSDGTSQAHIKKLIYDAQANGTNKIPQSNLSVSELFKLDNVGKNLGTTTGTDKEKLDKDLLTLEFGKNFTLESSATLQVSFADIVKKDNNSLQFNQNYTIFTATSLFYDKNLDIKLNLAGSESNFFATGKFQGNAFLVEFRRDDPRNFGNLNSHIKNPAHSPLLEILLQHNKNDASIDKAVNMSDYTALNQRLAQIDTSLKTIANADSAALKTLPLLQKQEINARIQQNRFTTAKFALAKITNPAQKSDIVPTLLYLDENERQNRVWSGASASFFGNGSDKFSLQSVSIGYDRKLFGDEFLLGILASLTNTQLSSDETSLNPKIYTLALYSDALFRHGELQNELSFSLLNGDKGFESENGSYKSFYGFFESVYKVQTAFLPQSIKPIVLGRVNLRHFDEFSTATYKQKADDDISVDLGVGVEWLWQKESGFYSASFVAERDIYHSQKERLMSLTGAQKFVAYETNEPSFSYQLYLAGLENFKNGIYLRYGLSGFVDSKAYKGFKADVQVGYRF